MAVRQKELMSGGVKSLKDFGALKPKEDYIDADFKELGNE
jgi:hypothetical protein